MKHDVKIVIGANYGDEGKGLMSRFFTKQFISEGKHPITVFHNGTAQRGHTADYEDGSRHVFHNFGAGTKEGGATYYAASFLVHPMDFMREVKELGYVPEVYCDPNCLVVTPLDMLADHIIEDYIAAVCGVREFGSCCYGSWSATDRAIQRPDIAYSVADFAQGFFDLKMIHLREWLGERLEQFGVDIELVPEWKEYIDVSSERYTNMCRHFLSDITDFLRYAKSRSFDQIWGQYDSLVFEGAQGLLLDKDMDSDWTTTSSTGLKNPVRLLHDYTSFDAEVCYVSRSYVTRHGSGPLLREVPKDTIGERIVDRTNRYNPFQGNLRYAKIYLPDVFQAIEDDFSTAERWQFHQTFALTHLNERDISGGDYRSHSPCEVVKA